MSFVIHFKPMSRLHVEGRFWALVAAVFVGIVLIARVFGPGIEAVKDPILTDQSASLGQRQSGNRMCWDWRTTKTRKAHLMAAYAQIYAGDKQYPEFSTGLSKPDGSPILGSGGVGYHSGELCTDMIPDQYWKNFRLGIQPILIYEDNPFWQIEQKAAWVDWYPQDTSGDPH